MNIPKRLAVARSDIMDVSIVFPSGKTVNISYGNPYITDDPAEIDFASRECKGVAVLDLSDKDFRGWVTSSAVDPSVANRMLTPEEAAEFLFHDAAEDRIVEELRARGYTVYKKAPKPDNKPARASKKGATKTKGDTV